MPTLMTEVTDAESLTSRAARLVDDAREFAGDMTDGGPYGGVPAEVRCRLGNAADVFAAALDAARPRR